MSTLPEEMFRHYDIVDEANRLSGIGGELELLRTRELLERYLGPPPDVVLDVGGAAGIHAFWLAAKGYEVHLIDPVERHIDAATEAASQDSDLASITIGDARHLDHADGSVDAVLLFGPLYHLTERADRLLALREALRVLRTGGVMMAQVISRFISHRRRRPALVH